jgi:predicted nucleotidyltransferase
MNKENIYKKLADLLKEQGAVKIAVFGSYVKNDENPESDIDVIVDFIDKKTLLDLVRIERELSDSLGVKVDLLTEKSISPYMIETIKNEMRVIYS